MAVSNTAVAALSGATLFRDTDCANAAVSVKGSSTVVYQIEVDNTGNGAASFLKIYNVASGSVTVGTTAPDMIIYAPASTKVTMVFPSGVTLGTAMTVACVTAAGTAGTTSPTSDVTVAVVYV